MTPTFQARVLAVVDSLDVFTSSKTIAVRAGLSYKRTIFALNSLYNQGKVSRLGRKSTAMWGSPRLVARNPAIEAFSTLEAVFHGFHNTHRGRGNR